MDLQHASASIATRARGALLVLMTSVIGFGAFMPVTAASAAVTTPVRAAATAAASTTAPSARHARASSVKGGYQLVASDGGIFSFGAAQFFGSTGSFALTEPIVGMAPTASGKGYWLVASDGGVFSFGDATFHGSTGGLALTRPIVGIAATASGHGYWLVASDGGIFSFGDAKYLGSTGGLALNKPIVGMAAIASGHGYWLVASDGGIFSFGDAKYLGSTRTLALKQPIVGMAVTPSNDGYWLVASDGGIFSFGDAKYFGSAGGLALNGPVVGMRATQTEVADHFLPATQLAFSTQPVDSTGGSSFASQPVVEIQDATGARVMDGTNDVSMRLTTAGGATLACDATDTSAIGGVATFAGCSIDLPGTYTLTATSGALDSAVSSSTTITVGAAAQLHFGTQPSGGVSSTPSPLSPWSRCRTRAATP
jgi:ribosomal protein L24E